MPGRTAQAFDVRDVDLHAGYAADFERFTDGGHQSYSVFIFVAHVRGVDAAQRSHGRSDRFHLAGFGEAAGHIEEARGEAEAAVLHLLADHLLHLGDLLVGGIARLAFHQSLTDGAMTGEAGYIRTDSLLFQGGEELPDRVLAAAAHARNDGGDTHPEVRFVALGLGVLQIRLKMVVRIDKSGAYDIPFGIDHLGCFALLLDLGIGRTHIDDLVAADDDVSLVGRGVGTVIKSASHDQNIPLCRHLCAICRGG